MKFWEVVISVLLVVLLENCVFAEGSSQAFLDYQAFVLTPAAEYFQTYLNLTNNIKQKCK